MPSITTPSEDVPSPRKSPFARFATENSAVVGFASLTDRALASVLFSTGRAPLLAVAVFLTVAVACGVTLLLRLPHTTIYGHDLFGFLDASWRVAQGQRPDVDFYSSFGTIFYLLCALGLRLAHYRVEGLVYAVVIAGLVAGVWSFLIVRIRLGAFAAILSSAFLMFFWVAPFPLGEPFYLPSYAMLYNRLGYIVLGITVIELFGVSDTDVQPSGISWAGVSTGIALGCLLFLKANFFVAGVLLCGLACVTKAKPWRHLASVALGLVLTSCIFFTYLHWNIGAFWHDLRITAGARGKRFNPAKDLIRTPLRNATTIVTLIALAVFAQLHVNDKAGKVSTRVRSAGLFALAAVLLDFVLGLSNQQRYGFPLTVIAILLVADQICRSGRYTADRQSGVPVVLAILMAITVLPFVTDTLNAWTIETTVRSNTVLANVARIDAPQMASLVFDDHVDPVWDQREANGGLLTAKVNNGLELLRANSAQSDSIVCLCYVNPFSYALMRKPARGGSPFFDYGTNFTEKFAPSAERILGDADIVIYPRQEKDSPTVGTLLRICQPLLSTRYQQFAESQEWVIFRKTQP